MRQHNVTKFKSLQVYELKLAGRRMESPTKRPNVYTQEEDHAILKYIRQPAGTGPNHHGSLAGDKLWKQMEAEKVTRHTWQGMKTRFKKYLGPHLAHMGEDVQEQQETAEHKQEDEELEEESNVKSEIQRVVSQLSNQHKVALAVVFHALIVTSGSVNKAVEYLKTGQGNALFFEFICSQGWLDSRRRWNSSCFSR
jgi:hypothetical protein